MQSLSIAIQHIRW